jgi:hypothetical protein
MDKNQQLLSDMSKEGAFVHTTSDKNTRKRSAKDKITIVLHQKSINNIRL